MVGRRSRSPERHDTWIDVHGERGGSAAPGGSTRAVRKHHQEESIEDAFGSTRCGSRH